MADSSEATAGALQWLKKKALGLLSIFTSNLRIESGSELVNDTSDTKLSGIAFAEEDQNLMQEQLDHRG